MSTTIPPEMVDYTIDFLYDDNASLKSCSLLSRSSLSTSHFHLFRRLVLEQKGSRDFEAFLTLLRSPTYLKFHVQELCLQDESEDDARRPIDSASLYAVLQNLPKLRGLLLCGVALFQSPFNYQWAPLQSLKRLTVYNVINCDDIILRVAAFFSSVSELYLLEASPYPLTLPVLGEPNVTGMSISSITTEGRNLAIISRILHNLTNFLTSLDISFPLWELAAHLSELAASLRIAGAYVQHLRLDITSICCLDIYSMTHHLDISHGSTLQSLHIRLLVYYDLMGLVVQWRCLMHILSTASPTLQRITLGLGCATNHALLQISKLAWSQISTLMTRFPALESVTFQAEDSRDGYRSTAECARSLSEGWKVHMMGSMPDLDASQKLRFL